MRFFKPLASILALIVGLGSCTLREDPGPIQYQEQPFVIADFDRLDIGDAMFVTVTRGNLFSVLARGDRRNLDDLEVYKAGNTLVAYLAALLRVMGLVLWRKPPLAPPTKR